MESSSPPARRPAGDRARTRGTRLVMVGAFVGALIVLTISTLLSWQFAGVSANGRGPRHGRAPEAHRTVQAVAGDCLQWTKPDSSDLTKVACDQSHLFQVAGDVDLRADHPAGTPYPSEEQWSGIRRERCVGPVATLIGGKFDPAGRYTLGAFNPSEQSWKDGERSIRCGLQLAGPSGALYPMTGRIAATEQSDVYPVGSCLGIDGKLFTDPIDCAKPHAYEIVGIIDLATVLKPADGFPDDKKQGVTIEPLCAKAAADHAGGPTVIADRKLTVTWDTRKQESWEAGSTKINCKVGAALPDGSGLAPVTGGVTGEVTIGTEPAPAADRGLRPGVPAPTVG